MNSDEVEQEFKAWLNERRMYDVSMVFHEIVVKFRELLKQQSEMQIMLRAAAKPDCTGCDGNGIYMGNVCICGCVSPANIK